MVARGRTAFCVGAGSDGAAVGRGTGVAFGLGRLDIGGSGRGSTIAAQMASAFGLRSWRGGVMGARAGIGDLSGERTGEEDRVLEDDSRATTSGGVGGDEAELGSRIVRTRG